MIINNLFLKRTTLSEKQSRNTAYNNSIKATGLSICGFCKCWLPPRLIVVVKLRKYSRDLSYDESRQTLGRWLSIHDKKGGRTNDQSQRVLSE